MSDVDIKHDDDHVERAVADLNAEAPARAEKLRDLERAVASTKPVPEGRLSVPFYLDLDRLQALAQAWSHGSDAEVLLARIRDLFQGQDGHLHRVERILRMYGRPV